MSKTTTVHIRFSPGEKLPHVEDELVVQGFARWRIKVLKILTSTPGADDFTMLTMRLRRELLKNELSWVVIRLLKHLNEGKEHSSSRVYPQRFCCLRHCPPVARVPRW